MRGGFEVQKTQRLTHEQQGNPSGRIVGEDNVRFYTDGTQRTSMVTRYVVGANGGKA